MFAPRLSPSLSSVLVASLVAGAGLTGCATTQGGAPADASSLKTPHRGPPSRPLGEVRSETLVFEEGTGLAFVDGRTGESLTWGEVEGRLLAHDFVVVGERHDSPADHGLQARTIAALGEAGSLAVALEMVPRHRQEVLERYNQGEIDEDGLAAAIGWEKVWGWDFELYRPIFEAGRQAGGRFVGVNAPRELVRQVARQGVENLPAEQRAELPSLDLSDEVHRSSIEQVFRHHHPPTASGGAFDRFYAAQVLWDESMAEGAARAKADVDRVVVLAGNGHVAGYRGIPNRLLRRQEGAELITVVPVDTGDGEDAEEAVREAIASGLGDILVVEKPREILSI